MVLCVDDGQTSMYAVCTLNIFSVGNLKWALGSHTMVKENIPLKGSTLMQILHCFEFLLSGFIF